mmetsp:Transcript_29058/g.51080  ORF Transcript_29058/g.51080 Transcript_29058/m.51080 type:complete len:205 (-) Transcript_29058:1328-1942(-)
MCVKPLLFFIFSLDPHLLFFFFFLFVYNSLIARDRCYVHACVRTLLFIHFRLNHSNTMNFISHPCALESFDQYSTIIFFLNLCNLILDHSYRCCISLVDDLSVAHNSQHISNLHLAFDHFASGNLRSLLSCKYGFHACLTSEFFNIGKFHFFQRLYFKSIENIIYHRTVHTNHIFFPDDFLGCRIWFDVKPYHDCVCNSRHISF